MDEIERQIRETLAMKPSPEFLARVRAEIAKQPIGPRVPWMWAMGVACAAIVVVAVTVSRQSPVVSRQSSVVSRQAPVVRLPASSSPSVEIQPMAAPSREPAVVAPIAASAPTASLNAEPPMPEVLISPDDVRAFQQYVASVRDGKIDASFDGPMPLAETYVATDLTIPAISVEPLDSPTANN